MAPLHCPLLVGTPGKKGCVRETRRPAERSNTSSPSVLALVLETLHWPLT